MEILHDKGNWTATETGVFSENMNGHGNYYVAALPFPQDEPTKTDIENLRLIAAAPEFYSFVKLVAAGHLTRDGFIDSAKRVLMKRRKMSEEDAHRFIQKASMDKNRPQKEIAEAIVLSNELAE